MKTIEIISVLFSVIGGIFIFVQWQKSLRIKRAEFIYQLLDKFSSDKDLIDATYMMEYDLGWYNKSFHSERCEKKIDKLLFFINYLCYLRATDNIYEKEFLIFKYQVNRNCLSSRQYLWNLYHFSKKNNADCPFQLIIEYGIKMVYCQKISKITRHSIRKPSIGNPSLTEYMQWRAYSTYPHIFCLRLSIANLYILIFLLIFSQIAN